MTSIILPTLNGANTIARAIESVLCQSDGDWELIIVDNGSDDNTYEIVSAISTRDHRIRCLQTGQKGVSSARNAGIMAAKGEYIVFIDDDDEILPNFLSANKHSDLTICGFQCANGFVFSPAPEGLTPRQFAPLLEIPYYLDTCWGKFFKREIIIQEHVRFSHSLKLAEDTCFCYEYLLHCNDVAVVSEPLYVYNGVWGGASGKYDLELSEFADILSKNICALRAISSECGINADFVGKAWFLDKVKNLFSDHVLDDVYQIYAREYQTNEDMAAFLADMRVSPLPLAKLHLNPKNLLTLIPRLKRFFTLPLSQTRFPSKKHRLFYTLIKSWPL